jgi:hypothetical protein
MMHQVLPKFFSCYCFDSFHISNTPIQDIPPAHAVPLANLHWRTSQKARKTIDSSRRVRTIPAQ